MLQNGNTLSLSTDSWWPPDDPAAFEFRTYTNELPQLACRKRFDLVLDRCGGLSAPQASDSALVNFLQHRIEERQPTSLIRLGDGEGNVLFHGLGIYPALDEYCLRKISTIWYGDADVAFRYADGLLDHLNQAIETADVIGGPEWGAIERRYETPWPQLDCRAATGMRGVYDYLSREARLLAHSPRWTSAWFSRSLLPHYKQLLAQAPFVGLVTCHEDLGARLEESLGGPEVETILVPMQWSMSRVNGHIGHYPDRFREVRAALAPPFEGAVYLVAAGVLAKPYCATIKQRGGIAIDIGSVADIWMGAKSRPGLSDEFVARWQLSGRHETPAE